MVLSIDALRLAHPGRPPLFGDLSLCVGPGEILALLGPNGAGKTSLLRAVIGTHRPVAGSIRLAGTETWRMTAGVLARSVAYVPQSIQNPLPLSARDVVLLGRTPHLGAFAMPGAVDRNMAEGMLERLGILHLADRRFDVMSGGERQLVLIARALAQTPRLLLLDEPTSNLDFGNQIRILTALRDLAADGLAIVVTTHFPDHAMLLRCRVAVLRGGESPVLGQACEVLTGALLSSVYRAPIRVAEIEAATPVGRTIKVCVPDLSDRAGGEAT